MQIPAGAGFAPNSDNTNPFLSDGQGHFNFALLPEQLGSIECSRALLHENHGAGLHHAHVEINIRPASNGLFVMSVSALDGQPIARAGSFELVNEPV